MAEECFQRQRGAEIAGENKRVSSIRKHHILISKQVMSEVNPLFDVTPAEPQRSAEIAAKVFKQAYPDVPEWLKGIATTQQTPPGFHLLLRTLLNIADFA